MQDIKLRSNYSIPVLGLGTWQMRGTACQEAVEIALGLGYRHIDTAEIYRNHREIAKGINKSGIKREKIFITTKVPPFKLAKSKVIESVKKYCEEFNTDYLDLLLIHWPNPFIQLSETLEAFEELRNKKMIRSYGVSNFGIDKLKKTLDGKFKITVNQIELHPSHFEKDLKIFCDQNNVVVTAYSPLGRGEDLDLNVIEELAEKYNRSSAQVILNWIISKGMVAIPKASNKKHLEDNFKTLEWKLAEDDIKKIDSIEKGGRSLLGLFLNF